jgi:competence protein ComGC
MLKNKKGFTLLEMLMVMFIISVLLLLTIPNITKHKESVDEKGCDAYADMVQSQVTAYELSEGELPTSLEQLKEAGYITSVTCSDETPLILEGSEVNVANSEK